MEINEKTLKIVQASLDGGFLQSSLWLDFQSKVGRKIYSIESENFVANAIEHILPIVGKYFYIPRGPIVSRSTDQELGIKKDMHELIELAREENVGWIRIEPENEQLLKKIKSNISEQIVKAPHDMQPREIFVLDISKSEEEMLGQMKAKTRYNINLAKKRGVVVECCTSEENVEAFLNLTKEMAQRNGIAVHPEAYYRKMIANLPSEMLTIYVAKYENRIIAANLVLFFGKFATYLHGASSNEHRNVMAPFLLQWQAILDAKAKGCIAYDFGGVKLKGSDNSWAGITNFKLGFSPQTKPVVFPGSYDIIINPRKYAVYRGLQRAKTLLKKIRK